MTAGMIFVLFVILLVVVTPIALIGHFITRWRTARALTDEEERRLVDLLETAERLRVRVAALEKVLDDQTPGWRT